MRYNGLIIGAGIIGSAVAYELSRRGISDLTVVDADLQGELSSTERNAGGVRHLWNQRVNSDLAKVSISYFEKVREEIGFASSGYLWLYGPEDVAGAKRTCDAMKARGLQYEELSVAEIQKRYPFIDKTEGLTMALFGPRDGILNSNSLKIHFRNEAKKAGVSFVDRKWAKAIRETAKGVEVDLQSFTTEGSAHDKLKSPLAPSPQATETAVCDFVVVANGAWSGLLLDSVGAEPKTQPIRRQMSLFKAENFDLNAYGMIVDTSRVYFHHEGGNIVAGHVLKDEPVGFNFNYDANFFEEHIWPALFERSTHLERLRPVSGWGGLYSYTPDTSGMLGKVPKTKAIYEAHSFTGRGVMQSYGAAVALAELITDGKFSTFDASSLSRQRFLSGDKSQLLPEELHI